MHILSEGTNMDYWDTVLRNLPDSYTRWFEEEAKYLHKLLTPKSRVLEVGCGDGRSIADILAITSNVVGIDHDMKAVEVARKNFEKYPDVTILQADASHLPFEGEQFDFVICMTSFANFADQKFLILEEIKRVLKKHGKMILSVFSQDALPERMKVYEATGVKIKNILENGTVIFDESLGANVSEQFSKKDLEDIAEKAQMHIVDLTQKEIAYLVTLSKP